jgi:hypothetical protein
MSRDFEVTLDPRSEQPDFIKTIEILCLHYLTRGGTKQPEGTLMPFREAPSALFYEPVFTARTVNPIIRCFGKNPAKLIETGELFGGVKSSEGDYSVRINVLPYVPVTYILWAGDDEFDPAGTVLFDRTAPGWLDAEDLVFAASFGAYEMIGAYKKSLAK